MGGTTAIHGGRSHVPASTSTSASTASTSANGTTVPSPLLSRPLLSLLLLLASGALFLCLLEVRTLTGAAAPSATASVATSSTQRSLSHVQPMSAFRPLQRLTDALAAGYQPIAAVLDEAHSAPAAAATAIPTVAHPDPWVSPLSGVHEWPPASPTKSTYRWMSHHTPLWQMVVEPKGQTVDLASVAIRRGRIVFYGLSDEQKAEIRDHFEPFMHFDGIVARLDKVEDVTEFVDEPLDWSSCNNVQPSYSFFVTPWMSMLYYHVVCEHLINGYANLRSANALSQRLQSTFDSPALASSHPRSLFHDPLPPFETSPSTLSPFTSSHLAADSHSALYIFKRWKEMDSSSAMDLLYSLHEGSVAPFSSLESESLTCFRRIRWGRGVPLHYFSRVFPFPLPPSAEVWSSTEDTSTPAAAKRLAASQLDLYTDVELGRWAGIVIDFHNYVMHTLGRDRRVRPQRHSATHEPLADSSVEADASPVILLVTRGTTGGRFIANRDCLISAFAALSLTLTPCCDWQAPLASTIASFQAADVLVGLHGAGFTNLLWMAPGGLVVEIKTHYNPDNNYFHPLSNHMDHHHTVVDGRPHHTGDSGYRFTDAWCADLAALTRREWQHKHTEQGRFGNVFGRGNFSVGWMKREDVAMQKK